MNRTHVPRALVVREPVRDCVAPPRTPSRRAPIPLSRSHDRRALARGQPDVPLYRVTVVARTTPAINYRHRGGATTIDFEGTQLLPHSRGEAKVESKQGYIEIEVEFDELEPAMKFGPEYLTYVMWAITPEGRATNLGEVLLNGTESKLNVTTELQMFGLVVTAEPYFAVSQPSDVVVMENRVRRETRGKVEQVEAKYELLKRGTYVMNTGGERRARSSATRRRRSNWTKRATPSTCRALAGADRYAADTFDARRDAAAAGRGIATTASAVARAW